ncbi:MAG: hypothetical protein WC686_04230 [Candidatus Shapirobacteria bacterium]|jgi:RimK family alpha-L-glutamate ligase
MKKIITFTMSMLQSQFEVDRVEEEAKKLGVGINRALYRDISFLINNQDDLSNGSPRVLVKGEEVNEKNTYGLWFRVAGTKSGKYTEGRNLVIRILRDKVFCCNHDGYLRWVRMGKIPQHGVFVENDIPVVPSRLFYTKDQVINAIGEMEREWGWPIIAKHEKGYQGKTVKKFDNRKELEKFVEKIKEINVGLFLWQKCLSTKWDLRVIVLDGKAIGAMKRTAKGKEFRSNFSLGGEVEKWELSESDRALAEKVARVCGLDYCGVDIMKNSKIKDQRSKLGDSDCFREEDYDSYVLEVNRQCQFKGFEMATGINVAKMVVEMLIKGR